MPVFAESRSTTISSSSSTTTTTATAEQIKPRRPGGLPRNHFIPQVQDLAFPTETETDPNANLNTSRSSKANAISSIFLSHFSNNPPEPPTSTPKKKSSTFRGLGCTAGAAHQVSVPAVIRSSAEWEGKRVQKKKNPHHQKRKKESLKIYSENGVGESSNKNGNNSEGCMVMQDVWCGPGIGFSADAIVGSVDCVVATSTTRRNVGNNNGRGRIDGEKMNTRERERERGRERERSSCLARRAAVNPEALSFLDTDPAFLTSHPEPEVLGNRYYRHVRHSSPDGLAELMMLQNSFMMGARLDRFRSWRLDIDHMSYEQLLDLGDRIGYVSTGLKEDEMGRCVQKIKISILDDLPSHLPMLGDKKCSICQEEYEADDEMGLLNCGHGFHTACIKQWLAEKNTCPVCKSEPVARC